MATLVTLRLRFLLLVVVLWCCWTVTDGSEFPERECCDSPDVIATGDSYSPPVLVPQHLPLPPPPMSPTLTTTTTSTEVAVIEKGPPTGPPHSPEHPDTSNFLFPEFIPELSLDLGYPLPPPPLHPYHHPHTPDANNNVPTTPGTGKENGVDPLHQNKNKKKKNHVQMLQVMSSA